MVTLFFADIRFGSVYAILGEFSEGLQELPLGPDIYAHRVKKGFEALQLAFQTFILLLQGLVLSENVINFSVHGMWLKNRPEKHSLTYISEHYSRKWLYDKNLETASEEEMFRGRSSQSLYP